MDHRERPFSLWIAFGLIVGALLVTSGRTLYDVYHLSWSRDDLAMSRIWAEAVWCNVAIWIVLGFPLLGTMVGSNLCRIAVTILTAVLMILLIYLMRFGVHTVSVWAIGILLAQFVGTAMFFVPASGRYFRTQRA